MRNLDTPPCDFLSADHGSATGALRAWPRENGKTRAFNHLVAGTHFARRFGRWPLPISDPRAYINDYIFARMIDPDWTEFQRAVVDKATAKLEASKLAPTLRVPETLRILPLDEIPSKEALYQALRPYICLLYTSPSPRDRQKSRMPSSA